MSVMLLWTEGDRDRGVPPRRIWLVSEFHPSLASRVCIKMRGIWGLPILWQWAVSDAVSKADRFEKVTETCRLILASAWKTPFHTSCGFFTTMWRAKGCILDYQRASILVTNCPIWVKTKSSVQLERKSKGM